MKRIIVFCVVLFSCIYGLQAETIILGRRPYTVQILETKGLQLGVQYTKKRYYDAEYDFKIIAHFLEIDLTNPYIRIESVVAKDSVTNSMETVSSMAIRKSRTGYTYFAGINADFFNITSDGRPQSGCAVQGLIGTKPTGVQHIAFAGNDPVLDKVTFSGSVLYNTKRLTFNDVNNFRGDNTLIFYNSLNGKTTHTDATGTEVLLELLPGETWGFNRSIAAKITKVEQRKGNLFIPANGCVLSGKGIWETILKTMTVGDEVTIDLELNFENNPSFSNRNITTLLGSHWTDRIINNGTSVEVEAVNNPRTGAGYSQDGKKLIMCVVDGRSTISQGCFGKELADMLKSMGAYEGISFDGGGSSAMYIKEMGGIVNVPSDGHERAVGNALYVVASDTPNTFLPEVKETVTKPSIGFDYFGQLLINAPETIRKVEIFNATGILMTTKFFRENSVRMDLQTYKSGVYLVKITTSTGSSTHKILKT
ncbi:MAG: phosphodiester glycosidase family protein [Dysgonamonadaceae bacterium]|jgi:hypothetical protein|nr:phosphodiester glycosidase family protein [Dysgonamonadaceae bacterium]